MDGVALLEKGALKAAVALPDRLKRLLLGPAPLADGHPLDLNAQLICRLDELTGSSLDASNISVEQARRNMLRGALVASGRRIAVAEVHEITLAGAAGGLAARRYVPFEARGHTAPGAAIVYFHGGGWVVGSIESHDNVCRALANASGMDVISVDYRLAPEHPFPAAVDDAEAAFRDVAARAGEFGFDPERIAVAGDSAGGHLSATVCIRAAESGGPTPAAQALIYPVIDFVETYRSEHDFAEGLLLTKRDMDRYRAWFLPNRSFEEPASPLRAASFAGLPPAYVLTAGFDPLRDEGEAYAAALEQAGVETVARRAAGQVHGFVNMFAVGPAAAGAIGEIAGALRVWLAAR